MPKANCDDQLDHTPDIELALRVLQATDPASKAYKLAERIIIPHLEMMLGESKPPQASKSTPEIKQPAKLSQKPAARTRIQFNP